MDAVCVPRETKYKIGAEVRSLIFLETKLAQLYSIGGQVLKQASIFRINLYQQSILTI